MPIPTLAELAYAKLSSDTGFHIHKYYQLVARGDAPRIHSPPSHKCNWCKKTGAPNTIQDADPYSICDECKNNNVEIIPFPRYDPHAQNYYAGHDPAIAGERTLDNSMRYTYSLNERRQVLRG